MKSLAIAIVLITWFFVTVIAAVTIFGLTLIVSHDGNPTTWMKIGQRLSEDLITYTPSKNS